MDIPWSRMALNRAHPSMELADASLNETEGEKLSMIVNPASAEKFFAGSGHTFAEIAALGKDRKPLPRFPAGRFDQSRDESGEDRSRVRQRDRQIARKRSGAEKRIRGSLRAHRPPGNRRADQRRQDLQRRHGQWFGFRAAARCGAILESRSRGAQALDSLCLCDAAKKKACSARNISPRIPRSPAKSIVADINTDMFLPLIPLKVLTVYGLQESDLGESSAKWQRRRE